VIRIGIGQATGTVILRLVAAGKIVAIAEGGKVGGSCVNYGCTPTKTLVASVRAAHLTRREPDFGIQTGEIKIDFNKVMDRQNQMRYDGSQEMETWLSGMDGVTIYPEYALFEGSHTIRVGEENCDFFSLNRI
jgi:pyruvate/2-oxoglutarate dehydrogenase complex dihydrolipoamide dehydrogenase (E3) component